MKLTKEQREEVVELLRCAADRGYLADVYDDASDWTLYIYAFNAAWLGIVDSVRNRPSDTEDRRGRYLEAALLIEEGVL